MGSLQEIETIEFVVCALGMFDGVDESQDRAVVRRADPVIVRVVTLCDRFKELRSEIRALLVSDETYVLSDPTLIDAKRGILIGLDPGLEVHLANRSGVLHSGLADHKTMRSFIHLRTIVLPSFAPGISAALAVAVVGSID